MRTVLFYTSLPFLYNLQICHFDRTPRAIFPIKTVLKIIKWDEAAENPRPDAALYGAALLLSPSSSRSR